MGSGGRGRGRGRGGRGGGGRGEFRSDADVAGGRVIEDAAAACGADVVPLVVLKRGKARLFREGNPLVFGGAVDCVIGSPPPRSGDRVVVTDGARNPVAWGVFNSDSMYRCVRVRLRARKAMSWPPCPPRPALLYPAIVPHSDATLTPALSTVRQCARAAERCGCCR